MKNIKTAVAVLLAMLSAWMLFEGAMVYFQTSGFVQGSEFGMLITLANQFSLIMLWLALFAIWSLLPIHSEVSSSSDA